MPYSSVQLQRLCRRGDRQTTRVCDSRARCCRFSVEPGGAPPAARRSSASPPWLPALPGGRLHVEPHGRRAGRLQSGAWSSTTTGPIDWMGSMAAAADPIACEMHPVNRGRAQTRSAMEIHAGSIPAAEVVALPHRCSTPRARPLSSDELPSSRAAALRCRDTR